MTHTMWKYSTDFEQLRPLTRRQQNLFPSPSVRRHLHSAKMENEKGEIVDLYVLFPPFFIPRGLIEGCVEFMR